MFELSLNTPWPLAGIGWKLLGNWQVMVGKKIQKVNNFILETSGKKFVVVFRDVFRAQSNIYDVAFWGK